MRIFGGINLNISDIFTLKLHIRPGYKVKMFRDQNFSCSLRLSYGRFSNWCTLFESREIWRTDFMILTYKVSSTLKAYNRISKPEQKNWCHEHFLNARHLSNVQDIRKQLREIFTSLNLNLASAGGDMRHQGR